MIHSVLLQHQSILLTIRVLIKYTNILKILDIEIYIAIGIRK